MILTFFSTLSLSALASCFNTVTPAGEALGAWGAFAECGPCRHRSTLGGGVGWVG